jgi:hypothetical protein
MGFIDIIGQATNRPEQPEDQKGEENEQAAEMSTAIQIGPSGVRIVVLCRVRARSSVHRRVGHGSGPLVLSLRMR